MTKQSNKRTTKPKSSSKPKGDAILVTIKAKLGTDKDLKKSNLAAEIAEVEFMKVFTPKELKEIMIYEPLTIDVIRPVIDAYIIDLFVNLGDDLKVVTAFRRNAIALGQTMETFFANNPVRFGNTRWLHAFVNYVV